MLGRDGDFMAVEIVTQPTASPRARWARIALAGPLALVCSIAILGGSLVWLPPGGGGVNHIVLPIVLYPAVWTSLFFHACFERRLGRGYAVVGGLLALHVVLIAVSRAGGAA